MNLAMPLSAQTFVNADVKVVLPWSTCPIVPMLTCGLRRSYFAFDMPHSFSDGAHDADRTRDLVLTKDVLYQLSYVGRRHPARMERAMGFEPTTTSLEGWDSTTELRPPLTT